MSSSSDQTTPSTSEDRIGEWRLEQEIGKGHFAKVRLATHARTRKRCAVKILKRGPKEQLAQTEIDVLKKVHHPFIVRCYDVIESETKIYFFMELMEGGELFDRIVDRGHFTEADAVTATVKLISAIKYLHDLGIAHRDLKPENMLMTDKSEDAECKITDFGLSKFFDAQSAVMQTPCGTPGYIAPEVLHMKGYDKACDVWSLGVIVYILLCGFPPFYADNDAQLYKRIKAGEFEFLRPYWDPISDDAKDLIRRMLTVDPRARITCADALQHPWLRDEAARLVPAIDAESDKQHVCSRKLKGAGVAVEAVDRLQRFSNSSTKK